METELYSPDLIIRKFAHLNIENWKEHVKAGDFKILADLIDGQKPRIIVRWPNTTVFKPDHRIVSVILVEIFHGISDAHIVYRGIYPCGFEITMR